MSVLLTCMSTCLVPGGVRQGYQIPRDWSSKQLWAATLVLVSNLGPLQEQEVLLIPQPSLQTRSSSFLVFFNLLLLMLLCLRIPSSAVGITAWVLSPNWLWCSHTHTRRLPGCFRQLFASTSMCLPPQILRASLVTSSLEYPCISRVGLKKQNSLQVFQVRRDLTQGHSCWSPGFSVAV